jgi:alpha-glucosidase
VRGRLYEDAGDGYGESRTTLVRGGLDGHVFRLERSATGTLPLLRASETLRVHGLPPPRAVSVSGARAHRVAGGAVDIEVAADWERIDLHVEEAGD